MAQERSEAALVLLTLAFIAASGLYGLAGRAPAAGYSVQTGRQPSVSQLRDAALKAAAPGGGPTEPPEEEPAVAAAVDLNTADIETLMTLPGIDRALAEAIAACRGENGPFTQADELYMISGVDTALLESLEERVFCGQP